MSYLNKVTVTGTDLKKLKSDFLAIGLFEDGGMTATGKQVNDLLKGAVKNAYDLKDLKGKEGETQLFYNSGDRYLVVGLGKSDKTNFFFGTGNTSVFTTTGVTCAGTL